MAFCRSRKSNWKVYDDTKCLGWCSIVLNLCALIQGIPRALSQFISEARIIRVAIFSVECGISCKRASLKQTLCLCPFCTLTVALGLFVTWLWGSAKKIVLSNSNSQISEWGTEQELLGEMNKWAQERSLEVFFCVACWPQQMGGQRMCVPRALWCWVRECVP